MKKRHVDHVLRAAGRIAGERQFIIIGSQSLHGKHPDLADEIMLSIEVDLVARQHPERTEFLNAIGADSQFHATYGYYADPVDLNTAVLPEGWQGRLVNLPAGDTDGVAGLCLEPHDLAISKYVAGRDKDSTFTAELARRRIVEDRRLLALLDDTPIDSARRKILAARIRRDFRNPGNGSSRRK
jgi:hypothetical protein